MTSDAAADAPSDNPASRKLPEPIETALSTLAKAARHSHGANDPDVRAALDAVRDAVRPSLLPAEMTPAIALVLGLPSFETGPTAHLFRAAGAEIKTRFEDEQAYVLFRFLHLALRLGLDWGREADRLVKEARETAKLRKAGEVRP